MRVIIAGSRTLTDKQLIVDATSEALLYGIEVTELVHGGCRGIDTLADAWAKENDIPVKVFPANWKLYGTAAGPLRNRAMAGYATALIAICKNKSVGTTNMIEQAERYGLKVYVKTVR